MNRWKPSARQFWLLASGILFAYPLEAQLTSAGSQFWNQDSTGIGGVAEAGDTFGRAVAVGDFNCDGFDDLAVGSPYENVEFDCNDDGTADENECVNAGAVNVIYGSAAGLHATLGHADQVLTQASSGAPGDPEPGDHFGWALAVMSIRLGDCDDLVVGVPDEDISNNPFPDHVDAGFVVYFEGTPSGLEGAGAFQQGVDGVPENPEDGDRFGAALAQGPLVETECATFGAETLAIGVPGEDLGLSSDNGIVIVVMTRLCDMGDNGDLPRVFDCSPFSPSPPCQDLNPGLFDKMGDSGTALAASRIDDRSPESFLAIGVPRWVNGSSNPGRVGILRSDGSGDFTGDLSTVCGQGLDGAAGAEEDGDMIGAALAIGDFDDDGRADLAVGAPFENVNSNSVVDAGGLNIFYGGSHSGAVYPTGGGPPAAPFFDQDDTHFDGAGGSDHFASSLATGDFDADGFDDLVIGVPDEDLSGGDDAGMIHVLYGSSAGITASGDQAYDLDEAGIPGTPQPQDYFGFALATGDFDGDGRDDLAVGTPGSTSDAQGGGVFVLFGGTGNGYLTRPQFAPAPDTYGEDNTTVTLTIERIGNRVYPISVGYNDQAAGTATAGADYQSFGGTLSWGAGDSTPRQIVVNLLEDTLDEPTETIVIALTANSGPGVDHSDSFTIAIVDDDAAPLVRHTQACRIVDESVGTVNLTVTRSGGSNGGVTVDYATANGSATSPQDYTAETGTLTFAVNDTAETIGIAVVNDVVDEYPLQTFRVALFNPGGGGTLGSPATVTVLIRDDDGPDPLFASSFECGDAADWGNGTP